MTSCDVASIAFAFRFVVGFGGGAAGLSSTFCLDTDILRCVTTPSASMAGFGGGAADLLATFFLDKKGGAKKSRQIKAFG